MCSDHKPGFFAFINYFWANSVFVIGRFLGIQHEKINFRCKRCDVDIELISKGKVIAYILSDFIVLWCAIAPVWIFSFLKNRTTAWITVFSVIIIIFLMEVFLYVYFHKTKKWKTINK